MIDEKIILSYLDKSIEKLERKIDRYGLVSCWRKEYTDMATLCTTITALELLRDKVLKLSGDTQKIEKIEEVF
jgi:hypothetical protein